MPLELVPQFGVFTDQELKEYRRCALIHARYIVNEQDAQEIASAVILHYLETGTHPHAGNPFQVIKYAVIDAIRRRFGRPGTQKYSFTQLERYGFSLDFKSPDTALLHETLADDRPNLVFSRDRLIARIIEKNLPPLQRGILILAVLWGLTDSELAHAFGVTTAYIGQLKRGAFFDETKLQAALPSGADKEIVKLQERVRHLEIILQAKGIKF